MIRIIGAGASGLLAGALQPGSIIYEAREENNKNNHEALFRFKDNKIGKYLGINFEKVRVNKAIWLDGKEVKPTPRITHLYSKKVSGKISDRSIFNIDPGIRYIPPDNFIDELRMRCHIEWGRKVDIQFLTASVAINGDNVISTIPMDKLLSILRINNDIDFTYRSIWVNKYKLFGCDANCTIYYPDPKMSIYRASIVKSTLILESIKPLVNPEELYTVCESIGINSEELTIKEKVSNYEQTLGKINKIESEKRKAIIKNFTINYGIYSLGRFATWRPKVMLDDVFEDILHIRRMIKDNGYSAIKHIQNDNN